jgi:hypothetical protein
MGLDQKRLRRTTLRLALFAVLAGLVANQVFASTHIAGSIMTAGREINITDATTEAEVLALLRKSRASTTGSEINGSSQPSVADAPLYPSRDNSVAIATAPPSSDDSDRIIHTEAAAAVAAAQKAERAFEIATAPDPDLSTLAYFQTAFYQGFRNQGMAFTAFVMYAAENNISQILLPTMRWKDLYGTDRFIPHEKLFDVVHWNSFYPVLPRLVSYHPVAHRHFNNSKNKWAIRNPQKTATHPLAYGIFKTLFEDYKKYNKRIRSAGESPLLNPVDLSIMRGAFRPHPDLQQHIQRLAGSMDDQTSDGSSYMALHARVEPDMQRHTFCRKIKVLNLQAIFDSMQKKFPEPPASKLFIAINRPMLETEGEDPDGENQVAVENLAVLNRASVEGLWGGRVKVFEAGMPSVNNTRYNEYPGISGSVVDYFLAVGAKVFVGTPVSSFSVDLIAARFYRGNKANYHYFPKGLKLATANNSSVPPHFNC